MTPPSRRPTLLLSLLLFYYYYYYIFAKFKTAVEILVISQFSKIFVDSEFQKQIIKSVEKNDGSEKMRLVLQILRNLAEMLRSERRKNM